MDNISLHQSPRRIGILIQHRGGAGEHSEPKSQEGLYHEWIYNMKSFPDFMKNPINKIDPSQQNTADIEGYYFEGTDETQIALLGVPC